jgi:hypothetical protein
MLSRMRKPDGDDYHIEENEKTKQKLKR